MMTTEKELREANETIKELKAEVEDLKGLNTTMSNHLNKAIDSRTKLTNALLEELDLVQYSDFKILEDDIEKLEDKLEDTLSQVEELEYQVENIPDDYELVDRVVESARFESVVEDIVKTTLRSIVLRMETE